MRTSEDILPSALLDRFRARAASYDAGNTFFTEDLEDLQAAGYLRLFVPREMGGYGLSLEEVVACQRRLAAAAPATALGINMHLVWTGIASVLRSGGAPWLDFVFEEAAAGEIFAFGLSEPGNDAGLFDSLTAAVPRPDGSVAFTGTKVFTSLSPVWTKLGTVGKDSSGAEPELVYGFLSRGTPGITVRDDWNTMGMRASQSNTTVLEDATVPAERMFRRLPVGPNRDPLVLAIFAVFEILLSAVYTGIADRAVELAVAAAHSKTSLKTGRTAAQDPDTRRRIASAVLRLDDVVPRLRLTAQDVDAGVDHGSLWFAKLAGLKVSATGAAFDAVEMALRVTGGSGYFRGQEIERLYRDVVAGLFHPSSEDSALGTIATAWLGPG